MSEESVMLYHQLGAYSLRKAEQYQNAVQYGFNSNKEEYQVYRDFT